MEKGPLSPDQFTATQFDSAEVKAAFGNHFLHFVHSEFNRSLFRKPFYNRLSMCFSHIAHYDLAGFYDVWFADDESRLNFLHHTLRFPCYGDPAYTYSDVEREIQRHILTTSLVRQYELRVAAAVRSREITQMERLQAKYLASQPAANNIPQTTVPAQPVSRLTIAESMSEPVQASLF
ncbi:MAG TPA: hypothetical protein VMU57_17725 [Edaphobacter sp.]|uniref:hypothetical protein n=1 Tax=Edaphobacter sp. TaxID=1934404 RepID=UPI002D01658F|nr:hypothetical protein [Edaphobacter sp.]HUZ96746.1 hypothetical protein [Edaphobacter sp.]